MGTGSFRNRLLCLFALTLPLTGCEPREGSWTPRSANQQSAEAEETADKPTEENQSSASTEDWRQSRAGRWRARSGRDPTNRANCTLLEDEPMVLVLSKGNREVQQRTYCSAYGHVAVRMLLDGRGETYLLHEHAEGRGWHGGTHYLTIYKVLADSLDERGRVIVRQPVGPAATSIFDYHLQTSPAGGIVLRGPWRVEDRVFRPDPALSRRATSLEIDVPGSAASDRRSGAPRARATSASEPRHIPHDYPTLSRWESRIGRWTAITEPDLRNRANCDYPDEARTLTLREGRGRLVQERYCSAYGGGHTRVIVDARGDPYLLRTEGEGRGTRATTTYLTVYKYSEEELDERGRFIIDQPVDFHADSVFDYQAYTPSGGGLVISGPWRIDGELSDPRYAPARRRTTLEIDLAGSESADR